MRYVVVRDVWVTRGTFKGEDDSPFEVVRYERYTKQRFVNAVRRTYGDNLIICDFSCEKVKRQMSLADFYANSETVTAE